jgi:hypothetical protein
MYLQPFNFPWPLFQFLTSTQSVGFPAWRIGPSQGCYLHKKHHKNKINSKGTSLNGRLAPRKAATYTQHNTRTEYTPLIPASRRANTAHASGRAVLSAARNVQPPQIPSRFLPSRVLDDRIIGLTLLRDMASDARIVGAHTAPRSSLGRKDSWGSHYCEI